MISNVCHRLGNEGCSTANSYLPCLIWLVCLSLNNLPKATEVVNNKAGWNLVSLVVQKFLLRSLFQLNVDGLASNKGHSPSSKEKKERRKGREAGLKSFPLWVYSFGDFLVAGNAAIAQACGKVLGDMVRWVRRLPRRKQHEMGTSLIGRRLGAHPSVPFYLPCTSCCKPQSIGWHIPQDSLSWLSLSPA